MRGDPDFEIACYRFSITIIGISLILAIIGAGLALVAS
jgi:hypothetical protein